MRKLKVGDPKDPSEPVNDGLVWNRVRQADANPAAKVLDAPDAEILQHPLDITHKSLLEILPVAAFEGKFMVMDDRTAHS